jgi:tRNA (adenine37-N6)-methyltransferase
MPPPRPALTVTPIGVVRSPFDERAEAPRQPRTAESVEGTVELYEGCGYEDALCDLALWDHVWLVVWFDRNRGFRPKVHPPRSAQRRGVFATRAPYRPNPIGLSAVQLLSIEGLTLQVRGLDLLDGTPLLDLKPYVSYTDAIPGANHGWLDAPVAAPAARPADPQPAYEVGFSPLAEAQLAFLQVEHEVDLRARIASQLALGPSPHAYRRIRREGDRMRLALKDWRAFFRVDGRAVTVLSIASGYRPRALFTPDGEAPPSHRAFVAKWPRG